MIHQKDWLMRQIEAMITAIVRFLFHTRKESQDTLQLQNEQIKKAIQNGQICQTEDWLLENANGVDESWLELAIYFYSEINKLSDEDLEARNFSREEIYSGLLEVIQKYGFEGIV